MRPRASGPITYTAAMRPTEGPTLSTTDGVHKHQNTTSDVYHDMYYYYCGLDCDGGAENCGWDL